MMKSTVDDFVSWFMNQAERLRREPSQDVAGEVADRLDEVDGRLGVEVQRDSGAGSRELVLTAYSDDSAFPIVREIAGKLREVGGWNVIGLKPPRGFGFALNISGERIDASAIRFRPIPDIPGGYQLVVPGILPGGEGAEEAAWLIVETGVGEELAGNIAHLEFSEEERGSPTHPIGDIANHLRGT